MAVVRIKVPNNQVGEIQETLRIMHGVNTTTVTIEDEDVDKNSKPYSKPYHRKRRKSTRSKIGMQANVITTYMREHPKKEYHCEELYALASDLGVKKSSMSNILYKIKQSGFIKSTQTGFYAAGV